MEAGMPVPCIKGTVKRVFDPVTGIAKSGTNKGKPYRFEKLVLTDGKEEITVTLSGREPFDKKLVGKPIYIVAYNGEHGWTGVKTKDDTWKDKDGEERTSRVLWVTSTAEITVGDPGAKQEEPEPDDPSNDDDGDLGPQKTPEPKKEAKTETKPVISDHKQAAARYNVLMEIAEDASRFGAANWETKTGMKLDPAHFQARTISIFIALSRWSQDHARFEELPFTLKN